MYVRFIGGIFTRFAHVALHLFGRIFEQFFDAGGVDTAVYHQLAQRPAGNFAPHRVKAGNRDSFGGVVHNHIHPSGHLKGANVAAVAADNPPLHLIARQRHHRNGRLRHIFTAHPLNGQRNVFACPIVRFFLGPLFHLAHDPRHILPRFLLHPQQ